LSLWPVFLEVQSDLNNLTMALDGTGGNIQNQDSEDRYQGLAMTILAYLFVVFAVLVHARAVPMPFHFTPVAAALLFFGARMPRKRMITPVALLIVCDIYLNKFVYGYPLGWDQVVTWAWYAAIILFGGLLARNTSVLRVAGASLVASVSFFLVSNFAVWTVSREMYPATWNGLVTCMVAGIPFFRNTLFSDLLFSAAFFGVGYLLSQRAHEGTSVALR
jgi:Family of unknown function (DUF6580)